MHIQSRSFGPPFYFCSIPEITDGMCIWEEFAITAIPGKGIGIVLKNCRAGLLIPYGEIIISPEQARRLKKHQYQDRDSYLMERPDGRSLDGHPNLEPEGMKHCWPAARENEMK